jgi:integrase
VENKLQVAETRAMAIRESTKFAAGIVPEGRTASLIDAWFAWQEKLPDDNVQKRAKSTIDENRREAEKIKLAFGHMDPCAISLTDAYAYLDACTESGRGQKGNKEIALLQLIMEFGVRKGVLGANPLARVKKNKSTYEGQFVADSAMELAVEVGRAFGGSKLIVALALKTAWLCVRRSVEVRSLTIQNITDAGIVWQDGKQTKGKKKPPVLIEWSKELKDTIDEARAIKRNKVHATLFLFGNMSGQKYTTSGWKSCLGYLMDECERLANERKIAFKRFNLQDCRPKGVSDKLSTGQTDTQDATGHTTDRMIRQVYDRRQVKKASPVR